MKDKDSLKKSADARFQQTKHAAEDIQHIISMMEDDGVCGQKLDSLRRATQKVSQCSHEFNAYWNALETE